VADAETKTRRGLTRREMIRASAVAGAAAWTAPVIIDSLASPAAATSIPPGNLGCSYAMVVFTVTGSSTVYVAKVGETGQSCQATGSTSADTAFTTTCNSVTYSNDNPGNVMTGVGGNPIAVYPTNPCPGLFTVSNGQIAAASNVTVLFSVAHAGGCKNVAGSVGTPQKKFCVACPPLNPSDIVPFGGCDGTE
jgi:hypothetical protein